MSLPVLRNEIIRKAPHRCVELWFALPIFTASRPATIVGVHELNFCVRDGREPERRLWREKRGRSECSGRSARSRLAATRRAGTANGNRWSTCSHAKKPRLFSRGFMFALPIFTASRPATIVGVHELNFCVRDGNRWTLMTINTNSWRWVLPIFYMSNAKASNSFWIIASFTALVNFFF